MTKAEILIELGKLFEETFGRPMPELRRETLPSQVAGWHSLRHAQLVMAIEARFGIEYPEEKYMDFKDVGDIIDVIAGLTGTP